MDLPVDPETFSISNMVNVMNKSLEGTGGSVQMRRRGRNGDTSHKIEEKDIDRINTDVKLKAVAEDLVGLSIAQKLDWALARRARGNELFGDGKLKEATDVYMQAVLGMDFSGTEEESTRCRQELQVPVLCNMAAIKLRTKEWRAAEAICTAALTVDADSVKALMRRGRARRELSNAKGAIADLTQARELATAEHSHLLQTIEKELKRAHKLKSKKTTQARSMMASLQDGSLYNDMPAAAASPQPSTTRADTTSNQNRRLIPVQAEPSWRMLCQRLGMAWITVLSLPFVGLAYCWRRHCKRERRAR